MILHKHRERYYRPGFFRLMSFPTTVHLDKWKKENTGNLFLDPEELKSSKPKLGEGLGK